MKIRTRLTILFALITATILLVFAAIIYFSASKEREKEFNALLKKEAITKANIFLNASVDQEILQEIYRNNRKILNEVEVAIYDTVFNLVYHDAADIDYVKETWEMIDEINQTGEISFYQADWQVVGLRYEFQGQRYIVTATALDQYGYNKLGSLLQTTVIVFVISILFISLAGWYFSKKAFAPVMDMIEKAANISATNLSLRLTQTNHKDELSQLANTFNEMLDRLEHSFEAQKNFVSNIAHELRTPLAAIIAELELSSNKERNIKQYEEAITNALGDTKRLGRLSNSLLDFAKASYDRSVITFKPIRLDEVLLDARQQVQKTNPDYKINIHFDAEFLAYENDNRLSVNGNEYLLKAAFANLFENGCKFSENKSSIVFISFNLSSITLTFKDDGIGIAEDDLKNIFTPFYRGENQVYAEGNGIGLSLTERIIALHNGSVDVLSTPNRGTSFILHLSMIKA